MTLRRRFYVLLPVLKGLAFLFATFARAQDVTDATGLEGDADRGRIVFQRVGYCVNCHGWAGDGQSGRSPFSHAAGGNLRETQLDIEGLTSVIKCGIPGTPMPYHDSMSYRDDRCFGMTMADFDPGTAPIRGKTFRDKQLTDLIAYLESHVIGLGKPTYEECADYFGTSAGKSCAYLK
jgi:Cytochrome c